MKRRLVALWLCACACTSGDVLTTRRPEPGLDVVPGAAALAPLASRVFTARVQGSQASVVWSSSAGSIEGSGLTITWTAPATVGPQTLTATLTSVPPRSVTVPITVSDQLAFDMAVPVAHPRLWWNTERLARARAWLVTHPFTAANDDPVGIALHALLSEQPAECAPAVAWALTVDLTTAPGDATRDHGEELALVYDWCHDAFDASQRDAFRDRWNSALARLSADSWGGPSMPQSDVFWTRLRNHFEWGVTSLGENPQAEGFLRDALEVRWRDAFVPHAASAGLGGGMQEGGLAGARALDAAVVPLVTARLWGRDLFSETDFFAAAVFHLAATTTPAPTVLRATSSRYFEVFPHNDEPDFGAGATGERRAWANFMRAAADQFGARAAGGVARSWLALTGAVASRHLLSVEVPAASVSFDTLPEDLFAAGPAWLLARDQWGPSAMVVRLQLGALAGTGHEHRDQGSFQLWRGGRWLSRETAAYFETFTGYAGVGTTPAEGSLTHNVLLFNGRGLATSTKEGTPKLLRLHRSEQFVWAVVDVTPAYRYTVGAPTDNPAVEHVEREFLFLRSEQALLIFDRLSANAVGATSADAVVKTFLMHFEVMPTFEGANAVQMVSGDQVVRLTTLSPAAPARRIVDEGGSGQLRLELEAAGPAVSHFLHVVQGRDLAAADRPVSAVETASGFVVTVGDATVVLEKGRVTTAGSVAVGGAPAVPLAVGVQTMSMSADGLSWATP